MNEIVFKHKFKRGQKIWHITPESAEGVILDITYSAILRKVSYVVALGFDSEVLCSEEELTETKVFG